MRVRAMVHRRLVLCPTRVLALASLALLAPVLLAGCTSQGEAEHSLARPVMQGATARGAMSPAERLANDLALADVAFESNDAKALANHLQSIDLAGATPSNAEGEAELNAWRSSIAATPSAMRGRVLGPAYLSGNLAAGARINTEQVLLGGKAVSIAAGTTPKDALRLRVVRDDGRMVCEKSPAHARECRFVPTYTQRFRIELYNAGQEDARYHLVFD